MKLLFKWHDYRYWPYERRFASEEVKALFGEIPQSAKEGLILNIRRPPRHFRELAKRTTYFSKVVIDDSEAVIPRQTLLESSTNGQILSHPKSSKLNSFLSLSRQSTRYSTHGLHEYRGKFNPQVVRAIGNMLQLKRGAWVLDPFCGSGTTLVEGHYAGWNAIGLDINPLAVDIANAKIAALKTKEEVFQDVANTFISRLHKAKLKARNLEPNKFSKLPNYPYLKRWFTPFVLIELNIISSEISIIQNSNIRLIFRIVYSDILRKVSLQDPGDLRIRRRKTLPAGVSAIDEFIKSINKKAKLIYNANIRPISPKSIQMAVHLDAKAISRTLLNDSLSMHVPAFDAVITSPPYATALPYIDTQRLSLAVLGLLRAEDFQSTEKTLIGTREITKKERAAYEAQIALNIAELPSRCIGFCKYLLEKASNESNGFRKRNVPSLVYKYLAEMSLAFIAVRSLLRPKGRFVLIVGRNRTTLANKDIVIDTPNLLADIAEADGFIVEKLHNLDTYQRYDMHKKNSINTEVMLVLRKS